MGWRRIVATAGMVAALAGCASGGPGDGVLARKLNWFSYLNGDDIRAACVPGAPDRFRLVLNADYTQQVRTYELMARADRGADLDLRVLPAADLSRLELQDPLGPWRGVQASIRLSPDQYAVVVEKLAQSGAFDPAPVGLILPSGGYYWLAAGCHDGEWFVTGWLYPSAHHDRAVFPAVLSAFDPTGVPLPAPGDRANAAAARSHRDDAPLHFSVEIGRKGLVGPTHLLEAMAELPAHWGEPVRR